MRRGLLIAVLSAAVSGSGVVPSLGSGLPLFAPLSDGVEIGLPELDSAVPSPAEFLGYPLGARFTHWERIVAYLERLAAVSDRVSIEEYGSTYEGRPLKLVAISSAGNIARIGELRERHLALAFPGEPSATAGREILDGDPVFVWLAYGVHGNESSSAEAAMATAYVLAAAQGEWAELLERGVVLIDPLSNPDGRERYVHFYETQRGRRPDPERMASEHWEWWPGGRQNHYLVDLNRDWAWGTQQETVARLGAYRAWEPQVYVDFHEMGAESTYFFPPAADPIHQQIGAATVRWLDVFGRANAAAFDRHGWLYYVGERFDLFYPGYGDAYPSLRGAVGMTYEMAGHGRAGQAYRRLDGSLLTLADRVARHFTTSLATTRTAIDHRQEMLREFLDSRRRPLDGSARTYLWEPGQQEAREAARLLELHGVELGRLETAATLRAAPLAGGEAVRRAFPAGTWTVSTRQPLGGLVRALMELEAEMPAVFLDEQRRRLEQNLEAEFYDITAWSLPLAYNLETWVAEGVVAGTGPAAFPDPEIAGEGEVGYLVPPAGIQGYRFAAGLQEAGVGYRLALRDFALGGRSYPAGTLFAPRRDNPVGLDDTVARLSRETGVAAFRIATGLSDEGVSLGSDAVVPIRRSVVGVVSGEGVSPTSFGFIWHLLDQQVGLAHHRLDVGSLSSLDLSRLDVLVLPDGRGYGRELSEKSAEELGRWVDGGGILVAVDRAVGWLKDRELVAVESWSPPERPEKKLPSEVVALTPADRAVYTPGAAVASELAAGHPLAVGLPAAPPVLFEGTTVLLPSGDPRRDVLVADRTRPVLAGWAWPEAAERLRGALLVGVEERGDGAVVLFAQEPAFRLFWRATAPLFLNAVMYGPSLAENRDL